MQEKKRGNLLVYGVMTIAIAGLIFFFSSQPADESSEVSGFVARFLEGILGHILPEDILHFLVRKAAHMTIYFLLGVSSMLLFAEAAQVYRLVRMRTYTWAITLLFCFLYACSDEWHQTFVQGRSGEFRDVMIDSIGVCLAVICVTVIKGLVAIYKRHRES